MSPEQARGEPADQRSDVFAFGLVLYEMLAGHRPFARRSAAETMSALLNEEAAPLSSLGVAVPGGWERVVRRCLAKSPDARFPSARDLLPALSSPYEDGSGTGEIPALVVLPFANLSSDPEDDWFSDGLTDELIADLSRVRNLRVISSPSAFRLKGTDKSVRQIAEELQVSHVLVGRVRKAGRSVRLTAQLIAARDDRTVWADKYTGDLGQAFELQEQVSRAIAGALAVQLREPAQATNPEAREAYLKGRHFYRQATVVGLQRALELFERATELDSSYAPALAGVAYTLTWLAAAWTALPARENMPRVKSHAQRALDLDPRLPAAHVAHGAVATYADWNPERAYASFREALRLSPDDPEAHFWFAHPLMWLDTRFEEARMHAHRAADLDPVNPWFQMWCSVAHYFSRDFEGAIERAHHLLALDPLWGSGHYFLGTCLATAGRLTEARASLERAIELAGRAVQFVSWLGCVHGLAGHEREALDCLAEMESREGGGSDVAAWKLPIYSGLGDGDNVMRCLEEAYQERSASLVFHLTHPLVDCVRRDDRFIDLLRRMKLAGLVGYRPSPEWKPLPEWRQP
jgi:TolB-like protein/Flp pilus assembly protein TadD